jgi:hypothetical protein
VTNITELTMVFETSFCWMKQSLLDIGEISGRDWATAVQPPGRTYLDLYYLSGAFEFGRQMDSH